MPQELRASQYYAQQIAKSRLFKDIISEAQAFVKIQAGREFGLGPVAAMNSLYIVPGSGKVTPEAKFIAAKIRASAKYDYEVITHNDDVCELAFYYKNPDNTLGRKLGVSRFDKADAKKAGTKNMDKFARNMLFARALTNGARWYCPDVMGDGTSVPYAIEELCDNFTYNSEGSVVLEAEVVNKDKEIDQDQAMLKSLLGEACKGVGLTLSSLAASLNVSESEFDSLDDASYERYLKLVQSRKKSK